MCDVIIPALIGVAALGLLGGGIGGDNCNPCGPTAGGYSITIPQEVGDVTNGVPVAMGAQQNYAYAPQPAYAGQSAYMAGGYGSPAYAPAGYGAPVGYAANPGVDLGANVGNGALGVGGAVDSSGVGVGANVGGFDASVGIGDRAY